jgi:hypothetical protein
MKPDLALAGRLRYLTATYFFVGAFSIWNDKDWVTSKFLLAQKIKSDSLIPWVGFRIVPIPRPHTAPSVNFVSCL